MLEKGSRKSGLAGSSLAVEIKEIMKKKSNNSIPITPTCPVLLCPYVAVEMNYELCYRNETPDFLLYYYLHITKIPLPASLPKLIKGRLKKFYFRKPQVT